MEEWDEFEFHIGPVGISWSWPWKFVRYNRTRDSHILRVKIDPSIQKQDIKARLLKPGVLEIEWPRSKRVEDIEVE